MTENSTQYRILFVVAKDRPGIVDDVSSVLFAHGANILDSRMAIMGGRFSIVTLFSCDETRLQKVKQGLKALENQGFEISFHQADSPDPARNASSFPLQMKVTSMDHPGIVRKVVAVLRRYHVNIQSMTTRSKRAPLSGSPIFQLALEGTIPSEPSINAVKRDLRDLALEMNLDLSFQAEFSES